MAIQGNMLLIEAREELSPKCLSVRLDGAGIVGEYFAFGSSWIASKMVDVMNEAVKNPLPVISFAKAALDIGKGTKRIDKKVPPAIFEFIDPDRRPETFEVSIPGLFDIIKIGITPELTDEAKSATLTVQRTNAALEQEGNEAFRFRLLAERQKALNRISVELDKQEKKERQELVAQISKSPAPQSSRQRAAILTAMDNVQDDVATLAAVLHVIEFIVGRSLPGIGKIALTADIMALAQAGLRVTPRNARLATKGKGAIKKEIARVGDGKFGTQKNRIEEANRAGKLGIGMADIIQGLQSLEQHTGYGLRLGPIFGALTDLYYGFLRGAQVFFSGPSWDPFNLTRVGCTRSPKLSDIATGAESVCNLAALRLWDQASRLLECPDCLTDLARRRVLWGLGLSAQCLYPWLIGEDWERDLENFRDEPVMGVYPRSRREELRWATFDDPENWRSTHLSGDPDRVISQKEWMEEGSSRTGAALLENINLLERPEASEVLEGVLVSSGYTLLAGLNPAGVLAEHVVSSSVTEDLRAFDGEPEADARFERLLAANTPDQNTAP